MDVVLREIENSAYLVAIVGSRYGWVPPPKRIGIQFMDRLMSGESPVGPLAAEEREALEALYSRPPAEDAYRLGELPQGAEGEEWVRRVYVAGDVLERAGFPEAGLSIQARGILHFLNLPWGPPRAVVGFRTSEATEEVQHEMPLSASTQRRLAKLRRAVEDAGAATFHYEGRWDPEQSRFVDLEPLGSFVSEFLWRKIAEDYPERTRAQGELAEEDDHNATFASALQEVYAARAEVDAEIDAYLAREDESGLLVVSGPPGSGKSSVLAAAWDRAIAAHPETLILAHFVGASPRSSNLRFTLRHLGQSLLRLLGNQEEAPVDLRDLKETFARLVRTLPRERKAILILDGLDHLDRLDWAHQLRWLPARWPVHVRCLVSSSAGPVLGALRHRAHLEVPLPPLPPQTSHRIAEQYLARYRKRLEPDQLYGLLTKSGVNLPLYLVVALEELRVFGRYDLLMDTIHRLPPEVEDLFQFVIARLEQDYGRPIVRSVLCTLLVSRSGLAVDDLSALAQAPPEEVRRILREERPYLRRRGELYSLANAALARGVREHYVEEDWLGWHGRLAEYFESEGSGSSTAADELAYQRILARDWPGAHRVLCDLEYIEERVRRHYGLVGLAADFNLAASAMREALQPNDLLLAEIEDFSRLISRVGSLFRSEGEENVVPVLALASADSGPLVSRATAVLERRLGDLPAVRARRTASAQRAHRFTEMLGSGGAVCVATSTGGALAASETGALVLWDYDSGERDLLGACPRGTRLLACSDWLACGVTLGDEVWCWNVESGESTRSWRFSSRVGAVAPVPPKESCLVGTEDGCLFLLECSGRSAPRKLASREDLAMSGISAAAVDPYRGVALMGFSDGT
ncbi:MAG TPA: AAA family ATPase, partial [Thermoanaerobaculia bacterium]|nr:AAA family ATPase [Thermoanaerobaculia bacterium]